MFMIPILFCFINTLLCIIEWIIDQFKSAPARVFCFLHFILVWILVLTGSILVSPVIAYYYIKTLHDGFYTNQSRNVAAPIVLSDSTHDISSQLCCEARTIEDGKTSSEDGAKATTKCH